ncbi:preprotein translocase subunit SecG [Thalassotalea agarivorans]|uniref:Protein-export membrane protein SecG n=1 Tax=Thalassotalea agarivorans TaxID=349064 RepID=A0A1I0FL51_THASX|nr:preprotein translocase subunit SecG [Thalassotalea agarivorans]SET58794.1 protein translocase subunit secG [Thalassotalea agarivorans]
MLYQVLIIVYLIVALALIGLVLIQQGKGADMGASFGAGSSATIFGSSGSGNFLTRATTWLAIAFFGISLVLGNLTANQIKSGDEFDDLSVPAAIEEPAESSAMPANEDVPASDDIPDSDVPN